MLWILFGFSCILLYYVNNSGPFYQAAVHIDCYRSVENSIGPWKCELCEDQDISLETSTASDKSDCNGKKLPFARCGMCHGTLGAFRKTADGQWVHAFCAEVIIDDNLLLLNFLLVLSLIFFQILSQWLLDTKYVRGQENPVEGMVHSSIHYRDFLVVLIY